VIFSEITEKKCVKVRYPELTAEVRIEKDCAAIFYSRLLLSNRTARLLRAYLYTTCSASQDSFTTECSAADDKLLRTVYIRAVRIELFTVRELIRTSDQLLKCRLLD